MKRYNNEGEAFLSRIVTGDESWVHHYSPETKRQSLEWKHPSSPVKKKFKSQLSAGKVMLTIFWDSKRPILEDFLEKGSTINSASYCDLLANRLKPAIRTKRRGLLSKKVLLQHDNARPHVAKATIETINKLGFEVLEHPAYSPDLAPSDYHLFAPLKTNNFNYVLYNLHFNLKRRPLEAKTIYFFQSNNAQRCTRFSDSRKFCSFA